MPKLLEPLLVDAVKTRFRAFNATVPSGATGVQPLTKGVGTPTSITGVTARVVASPRPAAPPVEAGLALFQSTSKTAADVELQTQATNEVAKFIAEIARAIVAAHENWRQRAFLTGVQINGVTANGGSISGPSLSEIVIASGPSQGLWGNAAGDTRAIGEGLAASWREWELTVRVPSLAWYPTLAAFPGPQAPPVANVPTPMSKLIWSASALSPENLKANMSRRLPKPGPFSEEIFASVADGFSKAVATWLSTQVVAGVLGRGSVPSFAPPYVPVGPVAGGSTLESGPHFST